ncbi:hypothetical protein [Mesopusillimonas faecipullorum]|uniref:hypothetical protein n=1 Tax=Mesopusillimonas faecipullorum TaxID=2755040 RepID=UPI001D013309|nr:hypothetical protein [Mesopusillimonas faecipullorum]
MNTLYLKLVQNTPMISLTSILVSFSESVVFRQMKRQQRRIGYSGNTGVIRLASGTYWDNR